MTNLIVRRSSGEQSPVPNEADPYRWMRWDPFRQMSSYVSGEAQPAHFTPAFEIKETKEGFIFRADVPGVKEKNIEITMTGNRLTISGKRDVVKEEDSDIYFARECSYGSFTRAFTLPEGTDANHQLHAELEHGVLTLFLPKRPEQQPRRIEVKGIDKAK